MFRKILRLFSPGKQKLEHLLPYPEGRRIYREFHSLRRELMDQDALKVINRLNRHGYRSYLVGGCVRDMILGRKPKDFDVVTSATPSQIRKVFSNSRSIGRRFKIVHIIFRGKIIEVSTFRSFPDQRLRPGFFRKKTDYMIKRDNQFGTPREDAARRDFTINALYFDPRNESIIDYVGGYDDILNRRLTIIGDPDISFQEDPVRMLRAAKFAALLDFKLDASAVRAIKRNREEITKSSPSRMLEEYSKIFRTGRASAVFASFSDTGLLKVLFPDSWEASELSRNKSLAFFDSLLGKRLAIADKMLSEREELTANIFISLLLSDNLKELIEGKVKENVIEFVKSRIDPACKKLQIPGKDRDRMMQVFMSQSRFTQTSRRKKFRPDLFRKKIFFFEAFMVFKINAIAAANEDAIQKAMFWEIGPRPRPPESNKIISIFPPRKYHHDRERDRDRDNRDRDRHPRRQHQPRRGPAPEEMEGDDIANDFNQSGELTEGRLETEFAGEEVEEAYDSEKP